ncbi:ABC transporter ATP-binding protein [Corynebacterium cystitidis]|uniref:ABC transporter ATP-binding protein n=1 Tax=Corynebacterium cystitidis TaxID=35757 RepID=UPI00211EC184|nr:ATP-binding cassette domain-containing protein [Corynebacterium cystitidis]
MLEIRNLTKTFGDTHALDGMSFTVHPGEIYGFVGSNGAGKSTTMRIALGVLSCDSGEVLLDGHELNDDTRRRIGYMPEERGLYGKERILSQLVFLGILHGMPRDEAESSGRDLLERLGLGERMGDKLDDLSLGNQQRVQLAASLIHDPDVLILDEPFSGLDPVAVQVMSEMLIERAARGVPVVFSSHQLDLVQRLCHRVGIVAHGRMVAEGTVNELRSRGPVHYAVGTEARGWYPTGTSLIDEHPSGVVLAISGGEAENDVDSAGSTNTVSDQDILRAALAAGPVHSFQRVLPDLNDLFKEVVSS